MLRRLLCWMGYHELRMVYWSMVGYEHLECKHCKMPHVVRR
jgi:hypothetical protein